MPCAFRLSTVSSSSRSERPSRSSRVTHRRSPGRACSTAIHRMLPGKRRGGWRGSSRQGAGRPAPRGRPRGRPRVPWSSVRRRRPGPGLHDQCGVSGGPFPPQAVLMGVAPSSPLVVGCHADVDCPRLLVGARVLARGPTSTLRPHSCSPPPQPVAEQQCAPVRRGSRKIPDSTRMTGILPVGRPSPVPAAQHVRRHPMNPTCRCMRARLECTCSCRPEWEDPPAPATRKRPCRPRPSRHRTPRTRIEHSPAPRDSRACRGHSRRRRSWITFAASSSPDSRLVS